jgi:uncharacterized protein YggU (UPF0235/DUF167 family)
MDSCRIAVRLTPRGGADRVEGWGEDDAGRRYLRVRVRAAPIEGEANAALEAVLAKALGLAKGSVRVAKGTTARLKQVAIDGLDEAAAMVRLAPPTA